MVSTVSAGHALPTAAALLLLSLAAARAQTTPQAVPQPAGTLDASASAAGHNSRRPDVSFQSGLLTVRANNSSLGQVLREVAAKSGMKISGAVPEDRVFGTYGPASAASVLETLLDGTGSNLLIVQNADHAATELILTRRIGGASPPNPNARSFEDSDDGEDGAPVRAVAPGFGQPASGFRAPGRAGPGGNDAGPASSAAPAATPSISTPDGTAPPAAAATPATDPAAATDGVKTPQQIFEQLQRLRQQQQQKSPQ